MSIKDRLKMIMEREKLTTGAFAESIGVAQATISHILRERNKYPSTEVILRLHQRYSDINLEWLLTGEGEMSNGTSSPAAASPDSNYPLFTVDAGNPSDDGTHKTENRGETTSATPQNSPNNIVRQEVVYKEKSVKKITEIRIFFDDNTYEIFKPEK